MPPLSRPRATVATVFWPCDHSQRARRVVPNWQPAVPAMHGNQQAVGALGRRLVLRAVYWRPLSSYCVAPVVGLHSPAGPVLCSRTRPAWADRRPRTESRSSSKSVVDRELRVAAALCNAWMKPNCPFARVPTWSVARARTRTRPLGGTGMEVWASRRSRRPRRHVSACLG